MANVTKKPQFWDIPMAGGQNMAANILLALNTSKYAVIGVDSPGYSNGGLTKNAVNSTGQSDGSYNVQVFDFYTQGLGAQYNNLAAFTLDGGAPSFADIGRPVVPSSNGVNVARAIDRPAAPTVGSVSSGTLAAASGLVAIAYTNANGVGPLSLVSAWSTAADYVLTVASPVAFPGATGYNVYASTGGALTLQNSSPIAIGTNWQEPTTGLTTTGPTSPSPVTSNYVLAGTIEQILANGTDVIVALAPLGARIQNYW